MSQMSCDITVVHRRNIKRNEKGECIPFESEDEEKKNDWYLVGAFRSNSSVPSYISRSKEYSMTIVPVTLPENKDVYFRKFKHCTDCDGLPSVVRRVYIVEIEHDGEWHFEAMFSNKEFQEEFLKHRSEVESRLVSAAKRRFYLSELAFNKECIISVINKERSTVNKNREVKSYAMQEEKKEVHKAIGAVSRLESNSHRIILLNITFFLLIVFFWLLPLYQ